MNYMEFFMQVKNNNFSSLYVFAGDEILVKKSMIDNLKNAVLEKEMQSFDFVEIKDKKPSFDTVYKSVSSIPIYSDKRLVHIENSEAIFSSLWTEKNLDEFLDISKKNTNTITTLSISSLDKRRKAVKKLLKFASLVEFKKIEAMEFSNWIEKELRLLKKKINGRELNYILKNSSYLHKDSELSLFHVRNQLIQLASLSENTVLTLDEIKEVFEENIECNIFSWREAVFKGRDELFVPYSKYLEQNGAHPIQMVYMLFSLNKDLIDVKSLLLAGYSINNIAELTGKKRFAIQKLSELCRDLNIDKLLSTLDSIERADDQLKVGGQDNETALQFLMYDIKRIVS